MENITEKAREVGRLISQTDEYKSLKRANEQIGDDRESVELMNRLRDLEGEITAMLRAGREPGEEVQEEYGKVAEQIQQRSAYQAVVAAQANFDRLMGRINEEIARGVEAGEQSRIIFP